MNAKQYEFVMQYLQHKDKITAYTIAYNKRTSNYRAVESAANRLLQNPEIKQYIANMRESMYNEAMQEVQKELKTELLTVHRKREVLARIVNGEHSVIQNFKGKNCQVCTYFLYPTIREILQGIREDNRMAGHYPSPAVASAKAGKNARYIDSIPRLAQTPLPAGLARFAQNENDISQSRKYGTTIIPQPVSPLHGDRGKTGEGGQLATDTPQPQNPQSRKYGTTNNKLSPSACPDDLGRGVSAAADEGGTLAPDTPETENPQHTATNDKNPDSYETCLPFRGIGGKLPQSTTYETTISHNISPSFIPPPAGGAGGRTTPENPEPQNPQHPTTNNKSKSPSGGTDSYRYRGQLPPDTPQPQKSQHFATNSKLSPVACPDDFGRGVSTAADEGGTFTTDTPYPILP